MRVLRCRFTQRLQKGRDLNALFEGSLENGDFQVYLQPKVGGKTEAWAGAEVLFVGTIPGGNDLSFRLHSLFEKNGEKYAVSIFMCV